MGDQIIGEGGAAVGIIFLILTVLIGVGMWVTNRRKERNQRREWEREERTARARIEEREAHR